jgi:hypothetical protein
VPCHTVPNYIAICALSLFTILYYHLCPVTLYHILLPSVPCHTVPYYIATSALSHCNILYCHLCPVTLHHIIFPSVTCHTVQNYIAISALSHCNILYCHLFPVTLYHSRPLGVANGATAAGPALEGAPRFRPKFLLISLSSYILFTLLSDTCSV